jgi:thiamine biosynthesis lipoprotein
MQFPKKYGFAAAALLLFCGCGKKEEAAYIQTIFIMGTPAHIKVFGAGEAEGRKLADAVFKEWKRIGDEYSFTEPYSYTSYLNEKAYGEWVRVDEELLKLLIQAGNYHKMTDGAFDVTFAPLWPIWQEAAASKKMPAKEDIAAALAGIGFEYVQVDPAKKMVRFTRPVRINLGGLLRSYALERGRAVIRRTMADKYPVELKIGGNLLAYGRRDWSYAVPDPFHEDAFLGRLYFGEGVVMCSSGRERFVQIEGKLYSHILDLKTGYPLPDFSNLIVYFTGAGNEEYIPSAVLAVMGKEKAFALLDRIKGSAALWVDGSGNVSPFLREGGSVRWEKTRKLF